MALVDFEAQPDVFAEMIADCTCEIVSGDSAPDPQLEALCEKLEISNEKLCEIAEQLNIPDLSGYQELGCVTEGEGKDKTVLGRVGACKTGDADGEIEFTVIYFPYGGEPVVGYEGEYEPCPEPAEYNKTDCVIVDETDPLCGLTVYECQATPGIPYVLNPETFLYEAVEVSKVGKNEPNQNICEYPFECEVTGDGATAITPASIIALQAGATFPGTTLAVDDAATVYLSEYSITLGHQGDESADTTGATGCDAIHTTVDTGKEINMEPGGMVGTSVPAGNDVPDFSNVPALDAVVRVCGKITVLKAKDGTAIAKPE